MYRSHITQELLNYFDDADPRVRENPNTVDAQLLNVLAMQMEEQQRRIRWHNDAAYVGTCPLNLDNRGVWNKLIVPSSAGNFKSVRGRLNGDWLVLHEYDDILPVPSRVEVDEAVASLPLADPVAFKMDGNGFIQSAAPGVLAFPNYLHLQVAGLGEYMDGVDVLITGYTYPETAGQQKLVTEQVPMTEELPFSTLHVWSRITNVTVRGLPVGATLTAYLFAAAMPQVPDVDRPYVHAAYRDMPFERFWTLDGHLLQENYFGSRFAGYERIHSYACRTRLNSIAVEPNTCGLYAADGSRLYYMDRREPMPDRLDETGLTEEPFYNLMVVPDGVVNGVRYVQLQGLPAARASRCHKHRYVIEIPGSENGIMYVVAPDGALVDYTPAAGWRAGAPKPTSVPVTEDGTYLITLESADAESYVTREAVPYRNSFFQPIREFDLSNLVPEVRAVAFDSRQRLWVWDSDQMIPLKIHYDAYLLDRATNQQLVYLTDTYEKVELS